MKLPPTVPGDADGVVDYPVSLVVGFEGDLAHIRKEGSSSNLQTLSGVTQNRRHVGRGLLHDRFPSVWD